MKTCSAEDLLGAAESQALKFELRDAYLTSDPAYLSWLAGDSIEKVSAGYADWTSLVRATVARGVRVRRTFAEQIGGLAYRHGRRSVLQREALRV